MKKIRHCALFKSIFKLAVRKAKIRPVCAVSLLLIILTGIYIKSPLYGYPIYLEGEENCFSALGIQNGDEIILEGKVSAISVKESGGKKVICSTISRIRTKTGLHITGPFENVLAYFPENTKINIGQNISFDGNLSFFSHASNPGEFDYYNYERSRGTLFAMYECNVVGVSSNYSHLRMWLYEKRLTGEQLLATYLSEEDAAIMKAMLFGNKNEIPQTTKEMFQKNGIAHILAISGLHISFLAMTLYSALKRLGVKQAICTIICTVIITMYGMMVGFSVSAFRAICMFLILMISKTLFRTYDIISALSFALILILLTQPGMIMDAGFQLSFSAVFGVGYLYNRFCRIWQCPEIVKPVMVSFFVFTGTLPVILCSYYEVSFYTVLLNLAIIPLMPVLILSAVILVATCNPTFAGISIIANVISLVSKIIAGILLLYKKSCVLLLNIYDGRLNLGKPECWQIVIYCILVIIAVNLAKKCRYLVPVLIFLALLTISVNLPGGFCIYQLDVGQGDCQVIQNDNGNTYLIDGGSSNVKSVGEKRVIPFLKWAGVNATDIFLSHPDEDHMNAIIELINKQTEEHIRIKHLYFYEGFASHPDMKEILSLAKETGVDAVGLKAGDTITDGKMSIEILYPYEGMPVMDTNNASLVFVVRYSEFSMADTGDIEMEGEKRIVRQYGSGSQKASDDHLNSDIIKVAHHGSSGSTSDEFMNMISPQIALISVGKRNAYGHPHQATINRLNDHKIRIVRTDQTGCITVRVNKDGKYVVRGYLNNK